MAAFIRHAALRHYAAAALTSRCTAVPQLLQLSAWLAPKEPWEPGAPCTFAAAAQPQLLEPEPDVAPPRQQTHSAAQHSGRGAPAFRQLNFDDPRAAFQSKSTGELALAYAVFSACQIRPLVQHADTVLKWSKRLLSSTLVNAVVKRTFFSHFCAGESQEDIRPRIKALYDAGIGGILDYAAEDDTAEGEGAASRAKSQGNIVARTHNYATEAACDVHMNVFLRCIAAAADAPGQGFAAIKVTALGQPKLLERVSTGLVAIKNLFGQFDLNHDNVVTRDEFSAVYGELFNDATPQRLDQLFKYLDADDTGCIDMLSWSRRVRLQDIPEVVKRCRAPGPLQASALSKEELALLDAMLGRLRCCAEAAAASNVRLMIDAEHRKYQAAIDYAVMQLQRAFNTHTPVIFNTYQCYLRDSHERFCLDRERARQEGFRVGAKLVRGAYMFHERDHAAKKGSASPVYDRIEETHANYDRIVQEALDAVQQEGAEFMIASHNQASIEKAVVSLHARGLDPGSAGVYFGQLLGMADNLSFVLGANGYRAYKYVPFGRVDEVMPYLIRRAQENSTVMGGVQAEKQMMLAELRRRVFRRG